MLTWSCAQASAYCAAGRPAPGLIGGQADEKTMCLLRRFKQDCRSELVISQVWFDVLPGGLCSTSAQRSAEFVLCVFERVMIYFYKL